MVSVKSQPPVSPFSPVSSPSLPVQSARLWSRLMHMAEVGAVGKNGVERLALDDADIEARLCLIHWARELGMEVWTDEAANIFARLEGGDTTLPPVLCGSHLDSQPRAGRFDGTLGVLAALEAIEAIRESGQVLERSLVLVNWTNEEGCRFAPACAGSGYFSGAHAIQSLLEATDAEGIAFGEAIDYWHKVSGLPLRPGPARPHAFLELHVEQGTVLTETGADVGLVRSMQACRWQQVKVRGRASHAGTIPLSQRADALLEAARMIVGLRSLGERFGEDARLTVGRLRAIPNTVNTICGESDFTVDLRHPDEALLENMNAEAMQYLRKPREGFSIEVEAVHDSAPVSFSEPVRDLLRICAKRLGYTCKELSSGAFHDAGPLARCCPTALVFVPSEGGLSHCEAEWTSPEQSLAGTRVLAEGLLELSRKTPLSG